MRAVLIILFFILNLYATKVIVKEKIPQDLKERFVTYWSYRGEGNFEESYAMELPYLQYLHSKKWYISYFFYAPRFYKVTLYRKEKCQSDICEVWLALYKDKASEPIYLKDKWIKIGNRWYHKYRDSALPTF